MQFLKFLKSFPKHLKKILQIKSSRHQSRSYQSIFRQKTKKIISCCWKFLIIEECVSLFNHHHYAPQQYVQIFTHEEKSSNLETELEELKNRLDYVIDQNKNLDDCLYRELDYKNKEKEGVVDFRSVICIHYQSSILKSFLQLQSLILKKQPRLLKQSQMASGPSNRWTAKNKQRRVSKQSPNLI